MKTTEFINENEFLAQDAHGMHEEHKLQSIRSSLHDLAVNSVAIHRLLRNLDNDSDIALYAESIKEANSLVQHVLDEVELSAAQHTANTEMEAFNPTIAEAKFAEETLPWETDAEAEKREKDGEKEKSAFKKPKNPNRTGPDAAKALAQKGASTVKAGASTVKEDATGGSSMSSSVAITPQTLGEKGTFSKKEVNKKLGGYSNVLTRGGPVKAKTPK
jgi:hypothetical protein